MDVSCKPNQLYLQREYARCTCRNLVLVEDLETVKHRHAISSSSHLRHDHTVHSFSTSIVEGSLIHPRRFFFSSERAASGSRFGSPS